MFQHRICYTEHWNNCSKWKKKSFQWCVLAEIPILQIGSSSYTTQVGSSVTLSCRVISATPAITDLFWRKQVNGVYTRITIDNNRFFGGSISNANLTISNVALSDQTSYQCSATNSAGTGNSGATTLSVSGSMFLFISRLSIMCYRKICKLMF